VLSVAYKWSISNKIQDKNVIESGVAPTILISTLSFLGLFISFTTGGGKEWAIMGLTKRLGEQRSMWLIGASISSIMICIIIGVGYSFLTNRLKSKLKKGKRD